MNIIFLMAGEGTRFKIKNSDIIKPLIDIHGSPMAVHAMQTLGMEGEKIVILQKNETGFKIEKEINKYFNKIKFLYTEKLTDGPACSALIAKDYIKNDDELIITNCDQILSWDSLAFKTFIKHINYDGIIVTYHCSSTKNSYAQMNKNGTVSKIKEKEVLSDVSLNGVHYWKRGKDFVESAEKMIQNNERYKNEFYVGPTYNYLIEEGKIVGIYHIPASQHHAIGTPEDLERYLNNANI